MSRIQIKNFGPIKSGATTTDGWIDFTKVTAFCGPQGSGKSTIVKIYSFFSWLEKVLTRGDYRESAWNNTKKFPKEFTDFHNVEEYFRPDTVLRYQGWSYSFTWGNGRFDLAKVQKPAAEYLMPKIMYVPAERNFMSVIEAVDKVKNIPQSLKAMTKEFLEACKNYSEGIEFPLEGFSFAYDKLNRIGKVRFKDGGEVRLSAASSGIQSMTPLFLVSEYLFNQLNEDRDASKGMSLREYRKVLDDVFEQLSVEELPDAIRQALSQYNAALNKRFINIVEEPEQNLFPTSQEKLLFKLIEYAKGNDRFQDNQLVLTTHSPYIINYLRLVTLAAENLDLFLQHGDQLHTVLTESSLINKDDVSLYETKSNGTIVRLTNDEGYVNDDNPLNNELKDIKEDTATAEEWKEGQYRDD